MRYFLIGIMSVATLVSPLTGGEDWTARSNENSKVMLDIMAKYGPEGAGRMGIEGLDEEIMDLKPKVNERLIADIHKAAKTLRKRLEEEKHPAVRQDLEILLEATAQFIKGQKLTERYEYGFNSLSRAIFFGFHGLLNDQVAPERYPAALVRLRRYTGLEEGYRPLTELALERMAEQRAKKGLRWPTKLELDQYLSDSPRFIAGIEQLFARFKVEGYEKAMATLKQQLTEYDAFVKETYLPHARTDFRMPLDLYRFSLEQMGNHLEPEEMINRAQIAFMDITQEMKALAPLVAKQIGLDSDDYRDVIRELKKHQLEGEAILPHYQNRLKELEVLIRKHEIITLPDRAMRIRLATEAESAGTPAPHMDPPRMIGNTGEVGDFVLPLRIPGDDGQDLQFDDFTFEAASWTLTVHEGRPGHELQFASIVEKGVSLARTLFAFNSVNAEGWALYTEAVMKPYMPLDGQLISLQHRLLRAARAFLDPKLQLGLINREEAKALLMDRVVLSEPMAKQEVDRYTFRMPGQAPSYFVGYSNLMALRAEMELVLGDNLNLKDFHDFILTQGLLPHNLLRQAVMDKFVPAALAKIEAKSSSL